MSGQQQTPVYYPEINTYSPDEKKYPPTGAAPTYSPQSTYYTATPPPPFMPAPGYNAPPPAITSQPQVTQVIFTSNQLGFKPQQITCECGATNAESVVKYETGLFTWLSAGCCFVFGLWCGCCCAPFVCDTFKDANHFCPKCHKMVGERTRL